MTLSRKNLMLYADNLCHYNNDQKLKDHQVECNHFQGQLQILLKTRINKYIESNLDLTIFRYFRNKDGLLFKRPHAILVNHCMHFIVEELQRQ